MKNKDKYIKIIKTRKYKNINLYLRFSMYLENDNKEILTLLSKMIGEASIKYPSKTDMANIKDYLYGISLECNTKSRGNIITLNLHYSFINPKFVDIDINDYCDFINETLNNTLINQKTLKEAKDMIVDASIRVLEKPSAYALQRFNEIVGLDNPEFKANSIGKDFIKKIKSIKLNDVLDLYHNILNTSQLNVYLCGDLNEYIISSLTNFDFKSRKDVKFKTNSYTYSKKDMIVDTKNMGQSILCSVYSTPFNKMHRDFFAWFVGNVFLGVVPTSLLFEEVREKLSLCYSISVRDFKNDGLVRITTFIDDDKADVVLKQINIQINRIINKDYDFNKLEMSKSLLINSLMSTYDDLDSLVDYYHESYLTNFNYSIEEYCKKVSLVKPSDLTRVFKKYNHYFDYLLKGNKHEKNIQ